MKNFLFVILLTLFFIFSFFMIEKKHVVATKKTDIEKRAIFVSYLELEEHIKDNNEDKSKQNIIEILDNIKTNNFNMIILHVRPFADSIYKSNIFNTSEFVKVNGNEPNYDILSFIIEESHKRNIELHAWINPYRISTNTDLSVLENPKIKELVDCDGVNIVKNKGIYFNPANNKAEDLIIEGVKEIVSNYKVDGILFDDYFYPDKKIDLNSYKEYVNNGGELPLKTFRYNVILSFIKRTYSSIKSINKDVLFTISPEANIENNYNNQFLDIKTILSNIGYIDYIMPQIYFGFNNSNKPFLKTLDEWNNLIKEKNIKLIPALAFYKIGEYDKYAGSGNNEWIDNNDIISRQIIESRKRSNFKGFALYRYDYLFNSKKSNDNIKNELIKVKEVLK